MIDESDIPVFETEYGPLRIVTPTQIVMDRMAAYIHWRDNQSLDQAKLVASHSDIDWDELHTWAKHEGKSRDSLPIYICRPEIEMNC